ncbi:MAG: hypothetical protein JXR53_15285 [Bacteroidales bacterium]|nr:hypothetical protein [Bacteroidales bacterium]
MKKIGLKLLLSFIIIVLITNCTKEEPINPIEENDTIIDSDTIRNDSISCEEYVTFDINDSYYLQNNVWGFYAASYDSGFTQCIFYDTIHPSNFGWKWELEGTSKFPSYPRVSYGWNPWFDESTTSKLPMKINSLYSVTSSFDKEYSFNGKYNTSFDIWLTSSDKPHEDNISAEIMIWLDSNTPPDTELTIESVVINNETYSFYKNTDWYSFPLLIFVNKDTTWSEQVNIHSFIEYLVRNDHISSDDYLSAIEFGNEIWSGTGTMQIKNYKIDIE